MNADDAPAVERVRQRLGDVLGGTVPVEVALRALAEPAFEDDLIKSRRAPGFLTALFDQAATRAFRPAAETAPEAVAPDGVELVARAASAAARWGRGGFRTVTDDVLRRREDACSSCPDLTDPTAVAQRLVPAGRTGRTRGKVCGLCGCVVSRKMRMATESCPAAHPVTAGLTRWGEPRRA